MQLRRGSDGYGPAGSRRPFACPHTTPSLHAAHKPYFCAQHGHSACRRRLGHVGIANNGKQAGKRSSVRAHSEEGESRHGPAEHKEGRAGEQARGAAHPVGKHRAYSRARIIVCGAAQAALPYGEFSGGLQLPTCSQSHLVLVPGLQPQSCPQQSLSPHSKTNRTQPQPTHDDDDASYFQLGVTQVAREPRSVSGSR